MSYFEIGFIAAGLVFFGFVYASRRRKQHECLLNGHVWATADNPRYRVECLHCGQEV